MGPQESKSRGAAFLKRIREWVEVGRSLMEVAAKSCAKTATRMLVQVAVSSSMRSRGGLFAVTAERTSTVAEVCATIRKKCELFAPFVVARLSCLLPLSECIGDVLGRDDVLTIEHA